MRAGALACCVGCVVSLSIIGTLIGVNYLVAGLTSYKNHAITAAYSVPGNCLVIAYQYAQGDSTCTIIKYTLAVSAPLRFVQIATTAGLSFFNGTSMFVATAYSNFFASSCGGVTNLALGANTSCFLKEGDAADVRVAPIASRDESLFALGVALVSICGITLVLFLLYNIALLIVTCCTQSGADEQDTETTTDATERGRNGAPDGDGGGGGVSHEPVDFPLEAGDKSWLRTMALRNSYAKMVIGKIRRMRRGRPAGGVGAGADGTSTEPTARPGDDGDGVPLEANPLHDGFRVSGSRPPPPMDAASADGGPPDAAVGGVAQRVIVAAAPQDRLDCPICFEPITEGCAMMLCGHVCCVPCVQNLLSVNYERGSLYMAPQLKCPVCRMVMPTEALRTVALDEVSLPSETPRGAGADDGEVAHTTAEAMCRAAD